MPDMTGLILGGGQGSRLFPLTKERSKPAVPVGGKYRLVDIPISNCINSGINRIFVLTQFASVSLHRHISSTYRFDVFHRGFVEILAAQQTLTSMNWYQGTADAIRQNLTRVENEGAEHTLILAGDQLYRMDFRDVLAVHVAKQADVTLCTIPVHRREAAAFGILQVDREGRIVNFAEKPKDPDVLDRLAVPEEQMRAEGVDPRGRDLIASMGIYLFRTSVLIEALKNTDYVDFGHHVFPRMLNSHRLQTFMFDGYWEDLGTIASFHRANLDLASSQPTFDFYAPGGVIYTRPRFLPSARIQGAQVRESIIGDGAVIGQDSVVDRCVLGVRSRVGGGAQLRECVMLGADYYDAPRSCSHEGQPELGIGAGTVIERAIVDKNCRIGCNVQIRADAPRKDIDTERYCIRDGIVVIPKGGVIPDGTVI